MFLLLLALLAVVIFFMVYENKNVLTTVKGTRDGYSMISYSVDYDDKDFVNVTAGGLDNDDVNRVTVAAKQFLDDHLKKCVVPLETNVIKKYTKKGSNMVKYESRFMFMVGDSEFPYGFGCDITVVDGKVVKAQSQQFEDKSMAYTSGLDDNFIPFSQIEEFKLY